MIHTHTRFVTVDDGCESCSEFQKQTSPCQFAFLASSEKMVSRNNCPVTPLLLYYFGRNFRGRVLASESFRATFNGSLNKKNSSIPNRLEYVVLNRQQSTLKMNPNPYFLLHVRWKLPRSLGTASGGVSTIGSYNMDDPRRGRQGAIIE